MSPRTIGSIALLFAITVAFIATASTDALARTPAGMTRLHHHHHHHHHHRTVHHSGQVRHGDMKGH
jgi:hypothetical protein